MAFLKSRELKISALFIKQSSSPTVFEMSNAGGLE